MSAPERDWPDCHRRKEEHDAVLEAAGGQLVLRFPQLPEGAYVADIEWDQEDGAATLTVELPDPDGALVCGSVGCPWCDLHPPLELL